MSFVRGNAYSREPRVTRMVNVDPVLVVIIALLLGVVLFVYLFIRRTLLAFSEGIRDSRRD